MSEHLTGQLIATPHPAGFDLDVDKTVRDLKDGSMSKVQAELDNERRTNPQMFDYFKEKVNYLAGKNLPEVELEDSGSNSKPEKIDWATAAPAKAEDLYKSGAGKMYTELSPPGFGEIAPGASRKGVDNNPYEVKRDPLFSHNAKFPLINRESAMQLNADGSRTYQYKGEIGSAWVSNSKANYYGTDTIYSLGRDNKFTGSETIGADGKLLTRHVEYESEPQKRTWHDFVFPPDYVKDNSPTALRTIPLFMARDKSTDGTLGPAGDVKSIDAKYNSATNQYDVKSTFQNGMSATETFDSQGWKIHDSQRDQAFNDDLLLEEGKGPNPQWRPTDVY